MKIKLEIEMFQNKNNLLWKLELKESMKNV